MNKTNRKLKKLMRDPKLFFKDMYLKNSVKLKKYIPSSHKGNNKFTIISAIYNTEKYLDEYFSSITTQSLSFKNNIFIICVDDGSVDDSAKIIKKWQRKYPKNITYIYKENGGQASARNVGIEHVQTEWVTFIDPDDFVSKNYFSEVDKQISESENVSLIACPLVFYFEDKDMFKDTHPLKYRFNKGNVTLPISDLKDKIQLSASTAFFKSSDIGSVRFDEKMKPSFEDAKFVIDYLLSNKNKYASFVSNISYYYRKRADGSSTLDGAWFNTNLFTRVLEEGCLKILNDAEKTFGYIPEYIQRTALYHLYWYFGRIINNESNLSHLTNEEKEKFKSLVFAIFKRIDNKVIEAFNLGGAWFFHKVGFLGLFKKSEPTNQIVYIEKYDIQKDQMLVSFFSTSDCFEEYLLNNKECLPKYKKLVNYHFLDSLFTKEYRVWIPCTEGAKLQVKINNKLAKLSFLGKHHNELNCSTVKNYFVKHSTKATQDWIFIDRNNQADDNAEHLYRYVMKNNPSQSIYFALNRDSHDWERLEKEGFNLLEFGSKKFEDILRKCEKIISSHIDGYITHYFKDNSLMDKDYVFLQHGITKDDLSSWLNTKKNMSLFVTATQDEYNSIRGNHSAYKFTDKEVILTGFPRHDALLAKNKHDSKTILIMPTWRNNIVGKILEGNKRSYNSQFMETEYAIHWQAFLKCQSVKMLSQKYGYKFIFAPHPNMQEYLKEFDIPEYIDIWKYSDGNIQNLFQNALVLITDYSSVAFDFAYLDKSVIYYQFDADAVFSGSHTYKKGYFSYEENGFGDVVNNLSELERSLSHLLIEEKGKPSSKYLKRINDTFPFRDGKNCQRVYEAITDLNEKDSSSLNLNMLIEDAISVQNSKNYLGIEKKYETLFQYINQSDYSHLQQTYMNALLKQNKLVKLKLYILNNHIEKKEFWLNLVDLQIGDTCKAVIYFTEHLPEKKSNLCLVMLHLSRIRHPLTKKIMTELAKTEINEIQATTIDIAKKVLANDEISALSLIDSLLEKKIDSESMFYKLELFASNLSMDIFKLEAANQYLVNYEKHTRNDPECRIAIARLAKINNNKAKLVDQLDKAFGEEHIILMPSDLYIDYLQGIENNHKKVNYLLDKWIAMQKNNIALINFKVKILLNENKWQDIISLLEKDDILKEESLAYAYVFSLFKLGKLDKANSLFGKIDKKESYFYWKLAAEHAEKNNNIELLKICLEKQYNCAIYLTQ